MQPLLQLLRWEHEIVILLMKDLQLYHYDARALLDAHPQHLREAWQKRLSARETATHFIAIAEKETRHD